MLHEVLGMLGQFAASAVHTAEALGTAGVLTDGAAKKGYAVAFVQQLADAFLDQHGLGFLKATVDPMIGGVIEAALLEAEHLLRGLGGIGSLAANLVKGLE